MSEGKKLLGTIFVRCRRLSIFLFSHIVVGYLLLKLYFMLIEFRILANDSAITCFHSLVTLAIIGPAILLYKAFHNTIPYTKLPSNCSKFQDWFTLSGHSFAVAVIECVHVHKAA